MDKKADALAFLAKHLTGVLATLSPAGTPRARTVYFAFDDSFNIYFLTFLKTRKAEDFEHHPQAAFVVAAEDVPQTLQIEGTVTDATDATVSDPVVHDLFQKLTSNKEYFAPLSRLDPSAVRFYKLSPSWVRWGDFTSGSHTDEVLFTLEP